MISQRIRQARTIAGLSQDEVVRALGGRGVPLTKAALSKYERGASVPRASLLKQLGAVLHVPAEYFPRTGRLDRLDRLPQTCRGGES